VLKYIKDAHSVFEADGKFWTCTHLQPAYLGIAADRVRSVGSAGWEFEHFSLLSVHSDFDDKTRCRCTHRRLSIIEFRAPHALLK